MPMPDSTGMRSVRHLLAGAPLLIVAGSSLTSRSPTGFTPPLSRFSLRFARRLTVGVDLTRDVDAAGCDDLADRERAVVHHDAAGYRASTRARIDGLMFDCAMLSP